MPFDATTTFDRERLLDEVVTAYLKEVGKRSGLL
jgi:hypothetical protein